MRTRRSVVVLLGLLCMAPTAGDGPLRIGYVTVETSGVPAPQITSPTSSAHTPMPPKKKKAAPSAPSRLQVNLRRHDDRGTGASVRGESSPAAPAEVRWRDHDLTAPLERDRRPERDAVLKAERMPERHREPQVDVCGRPRDGLRVLPERRRKTIRVVEAEARDTHHGYENLAVARLCRERVLLGSRGRHERGHEKRTAERAAPDHPRSTRTFAFAPSSASCPHAASTSSPRRRRTKQSKPDSTRTRWNARTPWKSGG